jgi:hypothetical protein
MLTLTYIKAILQNPFFYIEPYVHQILSLILSLILMHYATTISDLMIHVKDCAVTLLKDLFAKYEIKYPNFKVQLLEIFKANLDKSSLFTIYGAVKGINALGPAYVMDLVLPKLDDLFKRLNIDHAVVTEISKSQPENDKMQVEGEINYSQNIPGTFHMPIASSMFSEISHSNILPANNYSLIQKVTKINKDNKNAYYVYYALKVKYVKSGICEYTT